MRAWIGAFARAVRSDLLKLRRTHALVLPLLLPATPPLVFLVYVLQRGTAHYPEEVSPVAWTVQGVLSIWGNFLLPVIAAVECVLVASIEHGSNGWKQLLALPLPRSAVYASKLATMVVLVALAHLALFFYTLASVWTLARMQGDAGFDGPLLTTETLLFVGVVALGAAFMIAIHAALALRWASMAMNIGLALAGVLLSIVLVESTLRNFFPWALPGAVMNMAMPLLFGLEGRAAPVHVALLVAASCLAGGSVMLLVTWWLCRRDVP
jgi:hypothetical protein